MKTHQELLAEFGGMGSQHRFVLNSGERCEGWITEVKDDHALFVDAVAENRGEVKLRFASFDLASLAFRDEEKQCWVAVRWDDPNEVWHMTEIEEKKESDEPPPPQPFWKRAFGRSPVAAS
jgi:hypothetical protein